MTNINAQLSHVAYALARMEKRQGELPAQVEINKAQVNVVTLRSGRILPEVRKPEIEALPTEEVDMGSADEEEMARELDAEREAATMPKVNVHVYVPKAPFPGRLAKDRENQEMNEMLHVFKKVEVNLPLLTALRSMPRCAKFLKELCTRKVRFTDDARFQVGENVLAVLQPDMPTKCGDPWMFYIPCVIGTMKIEKAMLDLGASINVMPLSMYQDLEMGPLKPTRVAIQLADRSTVFPEGILEDVLVRVEDLIFPTDFYVLDMGRASAKAPVMLLGRPFLKTARTRINCDTGKLTCEFAGETVTFDIYKTMKQPNDTEMAKCIDHVE